MFIYSNVSYLIKTNFNSENVDIQLAGGDRGIADWQPRAWPKHTSCNIRVIDLVLHLSANRISLEDKLQFTPSANQTPGALCRAGPSGGDPSGEITARLRTWQWREVYQWRGPCTPAPRRERCSGRVTTSPVLTLTCATCFTRMHR